MLAGVLVYGSGVIVPGLSWRSVVCAFEFVFCGVALECVFGFGGDCVLGCGFGLDYRLLVCWGWCNTGFLCFV